MAKNLCNKSVKPKNAYEVWMDGGMTVWLVLKKYQAPEAESANPYARWFLATRGIGTGGSFELGDGYVRDVQTYGYKLTDDEANAFLVKTFGAGAGLTKVG